MAHSVAIAAGEGDDDDDDGGLLSISFASPSLDGGELEEGGAARGD